MNQQEVTKALVDTLLPGAVAVVVIVPFQGLNLAVAQGLIIFLASFAIHLLYLKYFSKISQQSWGYGRQGRPYQRPQTASPTTTTYRQRDPGSLNEMFAGMRQRSAGQSQTVANPAYNSVRGVSPQATSHQITNPRPHQGDVPFAPTQEVAALNYLVSAYPEWTLTSRGNGYCPIDTRTRRPMEELAYDRLPSGVQFIPSM